MKIIMVHGINQTDKDPETLKKIWIEAFLEGVFQAHIPNVPATTEFEFIYYGDLVKDYLNPPTSNKVLFDLQTNGFHAFEKNVNDLSLDEQDILINIADSMDGHSTDEMGTLPIEAIPVNLKSTLTPYSFIDKGAKALIKITSRFQKFHTWVLKIFAKEANLFLENEQYRSQVREKLLTEIKKDPSKEIVLVGHSLGSAVCLDALQHLNSSYKISRFVTLGSPLGIPVFYDYFKDRTKPSSLKGDWFNFYDTDDFVSAYLLTNPPYNVKPEIQNLRAKTQYFQPHYIVGYLDDALVVKKILGV